jgi:hypothetical protein
VAPGGQASCGSSWEEGDIGARRSRESVWLAIRMDDLGDYVGEGIVAGDRGQDFFARSGVGAGAATNIDSNGVDKLAIKFGFETTKTEVGGFVIAATGRAAGPVNGEGSGGGAELFEERVRESKSAGLGFNESEIAVISADTGNEAAEKRRGVGRKVLEERLLQEGGDASVGNIGKDDILCRGEA